MLAKLDLDERIANAFETELSSEALSSLLEETIAADEAAQIAFDEAKATALNPATRPAEVSKARQAMEDAQFRRDRMAIAATKIEELHKEALAREAAGRLDEEYSAAKAERDQLVKDLKAQYPELAGKLVALIARVQANNERVQKANAGRAGKERLRSAEAIARNAPDNFEANADAGLPHLKAARIPSFERGSSGYLWPEPSRF